MPKTTLKRIHREIADLKKEDLGNITLGPSDDSLFHWKATIPGPEGSVYEGGAFNVDINLAHDYPYVNFFSCSFKYLYVPYQVFCAEDGFSYSVSMYPIATFNLY